MRRISMSLLVVVFISACSGAPVAAPVASVPSATTPVPATIEAPTEAPTVAPTNLPTDVPADVPADTPTPESTASATSAPSATPTETVTETPLPLPTIADTPVAETPSNAANEAVGDVARGAELFARGLNGAPPCSTCHLTQEGQTGFSLGPNLAHVSERAGARVEGEDIDAYLHQSILEPNAFLVPGYRSIMYPEYGKHYSDSEIEDLIAFLKSL